MATTTPQKTDYALLWLDQIANATEDQRTVSIPEQHFRTLEAMGLVIGPATAAKLSPAGVAQLLVKNKAEKKTTKKTTKKSRRK